MFVGFFCPLVDRFCSPAILTNSPVAIVIALAVAAVGGILSPTAPDMGAKGVLERYRQIQPRLILAETCVVYAGKHIDVTEKLREVSIELQDFGLKKLVLVKGARETREGTHHIQTA